LLLPAAPDLLLLLLVMVALLLLWLYTGLSAESSMKALSRCSQLLLSGSPATTCCCCCCCCSGGNCSCCSRFHRARVMRIVLVAVSLQTSGPLAAVAAAVAAAAGDAAQRRAKGRSVLLVRQSLRPPAFGFAQLNRVWPANRIAPLQVTTKKMRVCNAVQCVANERRTAASCGIIRPTGWSNQATSHEASPLSLPWSGVRSSRVLT
jgi:hypothetical protein